MNIEFPVIIGHGCDYYTPGDPFEVIHNIRETIAQAIYSGFTVKLFKRESLVRGAYGYDSKFNKSIVEVRSDVGVNLSGLLEFLYKDMKNDDRFGDRMFIDEELEPFLTHDDFDRLLGILEFSYATSVSIYREPGNLNIKDNDSGVKITIIDSLYSGNTTPEIVEDTISFFEGFLQEELGIT